MKKLCTEIYKLSNNPATRLKYKHQSRILDSILNDVDKKIIKLKKRKKKEFNNIEVKTMGRNIDFEEFGLTAIRCKKCGKDLDLSEVDIDCDLSTHNPMSFELSLQCYECEEENKIKFRVIEEKE